ncbi:hypothetical protein Agub_g3793 [Astrephomene gubernaculifera]|uniref:Uncharacterized protein n=1 Tax=Astrephomene gubernaculifera TaxID=47775 RepID=A0AAD3DJ96_9CHLO|nr:hypothetical protein Agub_g3793 [Astrephomene gubernaculifera]
MEHTLEYNVLKERAYTTRGVISQPSLEEMQLWVSGANRRRSNCYAAEPEALEHPAESFKALEQRYHLEDVWGQNTTPAMQTLECIQKVKQALVEGSDPEDSISGKTFSILVAISLAAAVLIVLVWELYLRPRDRGGMRSV